MRYHYILLICSIGIVKGQLGYSKDVPSKAFGYDQISQKYETFDEEQNGNEGIQGEPGQDYPVYNEVPATGFDCNDQQYPGYFADPEAKCQVFHICQRGGQKDSFLCPIGSIFNQEFLVCDWWFNVDCNKAVQLYRINEMIFNAMEEANVKGNNFELQAYKNNDDSRPKTSYDVPSSYKTDDYNGAIKQEYATPSERLTSNGYHQSSSEPIYGTPSQKATDVNSLPKPVYGLPTEKLINNGTPKSVYDHPSAKLTNGSPKPTYGAPAQKLVNSGYNSNNRNGASPKPVYGVPDNNDKGIYSSKYSGVVSQINSLADSNKFNGYEQNNAARGGNINNAYLPPNGNNNNGNGVETEADDEAIDLLQPVAELEALKQSEEPSRSYLPPV